MARIPEQLTFRVLGELEVRRGESVLELPPSKKTRALLAYLLLTARAHRREQLCRLLWDVTDDPRGALRWSLSKLRPLFDGNSGARLIADRELVRCEVEPRNVDLFALRTDQPGEANLLRAMQLRTGELLEGLDLPDFDDYQAWLVAEREGARLHRIRVLRELAASDAWGAERQMEAARLWVQLDPLNETARADLIRLLARLGRRDEARQHYESGLRLERELGRKSKGELRDAFEALNATSAPAAPPVELELAPTKEADGTPDELPFVGRAAERSLLDESLARCRERQRLELLVISGEPGVGKTRLLQAWRQQLAETPYLYGACFEAERGNPYGPWLEALRSADASRFGWRPLIERLEGAQGSVEEPAHGRGRENLFGAVADAVQALSARGPGIPMVLDDAQWLDDGSAELLHYVARINRNRPVLIVLLAREGEVGDNPALLRVLRSLRRTAHLSEHKLGPLPDADLAQLLRALGKESEIERIARESSGNPLYALELTRADHETGTFPGGLSSLIRDRLSQLPEQALDVLRWAAVLGSGFEVAQLAALSSLALETLVASLELLESRALLRREPGRPGSTSYVFSHEIMRRVVYADLSDPRRKLMHRRVAEWISRRPEPSPEALAAIAHHALLAEDSALAADACLVAARRSLRLFANVDAHALARRGLRHAERLEDPDRTCRMLELLQVSLQAQRPVHAAEVARQLETLADRALDLGRMEHARIGFHALAYLSYDTGDFVHAQKHMLQAELASRGADERERVLGMAEAARCLVMLERDLGHAHALALEAAARARNAGLEPAAVFDALGMLKLHQGKLDEAAPELERACAIARTGRDRYAEYQAMEHLVMLEIERHEYMSALAQAQRLSELGDKLREGSEAPFARALVALCKVALGDLPAQAELDRLVTELTEVDAKLRLAYLLSRAAWLDLQHGEVTRAGQRAQLALSCAELLERPSESALARLIMLRCARKQGDGAALRMAEAHLVRQSLANVAKTVRDLVSEELGGSVSTEGARP